MAQNIKVTGYNLGDNSPPYEIRENSESGSIVADNVTFSELVNGIVVAVTDGVGSVAVVSKEGFCSGSSGKASWVVPSPTPSAVPASPSASPAPPASPSSTPAASPVSPTPSPSTVPPTPSPSSGGVSPTPSPSTVPPTPSPSTSVPSYNYYRLDECDGGPQELILRSYSSYSTNTSFEFFGGCYRIYQFTNEADWDANPGLQIQGEGTAYANCTECEGPSPTPSPSTVPPTPTPSSSTVPTVYSFGFGGARNSVSLACLVVGTGTTVWSQDSAISTGTVLYTSQADAEAGGTGNLANGFWGHNLSGFGDAAIEVSGGTVISITFC